MKLEITQADALELIEHDRVLELLTKNPDDETSRVTLRDFLRHNHRVSKGVINALIIFLVTYETPNKPKGVLPRSPAYLRKTLETWKAQGITSPQRAFKFFKDYYESLQDRQSDALEKIKENPNEPSWLPGYLEELAKMEG